MTDVLSAAGRAMFKAMLAALLVVAIGISASPNLANTGAFAVAGLISILAAGLAAFQTFIPALAFKAYLPDPWGRMLDSFAHASIAAFVVTTLGWLAMPDLSTWKSVLVAATIGAVNAGFRAIQGALSPTEAPFRSEGITAPPVRLASP